MALLIDLKQPVWMKDKDLRDELLEFNPQVDIRCGDSPGNLEEIEMLAVSNYYRGEALRYPNLKLIQKTGAGVDMVMSDDLLPKSIRVARLSSGTPGREIAEYSLACVLQEQRHLRLYLGNQSSFLWDARAPRRASKTTVAVLGLGRIGALCARKFVDNEFRVFGWSRSEKSLPDVECHHGYEQLKTVLGEADYVVSVLPSTAETTCLFNRERFRWMKPGSVIINVGRGTLIDEEDLVQALDEGLLATAILDVVQAEPLPTESPLWQHPKVIVTPHVSGWHLGDSIREIAENLRRLESGEPILNLVDRELGY